MNVLITGTSKGIGKAIAKKFLSNGFTVFGFDVLDATINAPLYTHFKVDIKQRNLPELKDINYLINNAGTQNNNDIDNNLKGTINITEKYAFTKNIKAVVNICSTSAHNGAEFPEYCASKGGMLSYTKNVASRISKWGATCNSISPGGVITELNEHIINNPELWQQVLNETTLHKWASPEEIAEWVYFVSVINKSMTAQDIIIDNGEMSKFNFIW